MKMKLSDKEIIERTLKDPSFQEDPTLMMEIVLGNCTDFKNEKSALQEVIQSRGHIMLTSVKCHPELAGNRVQ